MLSSFPLLQYRIIAFLSYQILVSSRTAPSDQPVINPLVFHISQVQLKRHTDSAVLFTVTSHVFKFLMQKTCVDEIFGCKTDTQWNNKSDENGMAFLMLAGAYPFCFCWVWGTLCVQFGRFGIVGIHHWLVTSWPTRCSQEMPWTVLVGASSYTTLLRRPKRTSCGNCSGRSVRCRVWKSFETCRPTSAKGLASWRWPIMMRPSLQSSLWMAIPWATASCRFPSKPTRVKPHKFWRRNCYEPPPYWQCGCYCDHASQLRLHLSPQSFYVRNLSGSKHPEKTAVCWEKWRYLPHAPHLRL